MADDVQSSFVKGRQPSVLARFAALLIRAYQLLLSPLKQYFFGAACGCRFQPTCSCYARDALLKHGFFRGLVLAFLRICRCHPWSKGGFDPVPDLKRSNGQAIAQPFDSNLDG